MSHRFRRASIAVLTLAVIVLLGGVGKAQSKITLPLPSTFDSYIQRVSAAGFAGAVFIAQGDRVLLRSAYGLANDTLGQTFTPETVVDIGSLAKQFTAVGILKLVEQGKLTVTDTLAAFFPDLPADRASITIHQLLTHTAGLLNVVEGDLTPLSRAAALDHIFSQPLTGKPGAAYSYCNACYSVLAAIIEARSGQSYADYMHSQLFAPAGLRHTGFYGEPRWQGQPVAHGYLNDTDQGSPASWPGPYWGVMGNGGILSTVDDLARWWKVLRAHRLLTPALTEQLFTRQVVQDSADTFYGYGWSIGSGPLGEEISHNGGGIGGNSDLAYLPEQDMLIILLGNRIVYRTLGNDLPYEVRLFASDTRAQLVENSATGDFSPLPQPTFVLPSLLIIGVLALAATVGVGGVAWLRRRSVTRSKVQARQG
jgi:CubicO group peptidase (beta-lactamase class C family)